MQSSREVLRPRATPITTAVFVVCILAGAAVLLVALDRTGDTNVFAIGAIAFVVISTVIAAVLLVRPRVVLTPTEIVVRNTIKTRTLAWSQVVALRFSRHDSFARLDLIDGSTWPITAIQSSDGEHGRRCAAQIRDWIELHEGREPVRRPR